MQPLDLHLSELWLLWFCLVCLSCLLDDPDGPTGLNLEPHEDQHFLALWLAKGAFPSPPPHSCLLSRQPLPASGPDLLDTSLIPTSPTTSYKLPFCKLEKANLPPDTAAICQKTVVVNTPRDHENGPPRPANCVVHNWFSCM